MEYRYVTNGSVYFPQYKLAAEKDWENVMQHHIKDTSLQPIVWGLVGSKRWCNEDKEVYFTQEILVNAFLGAFKFTNGAQPRHFE